MKSKLLITFGLICLLGGMLVLAVTFYPILLNEIRFYMDRNTEISVVEKGDGLPGNEIVVRDMVFGVVIPKIRANASIVENVDPNDREQYQKALAKGVAHALGTSLPGENGNIFLFSHSSVNFFEASRYNSIFYLLNKLENGDEILIYKDGKKYTYHVDGKELVDPEAVSYLDRGLDGPKLTLMTCWPPGTTLKRLIVIAHLSGD